MRRSMIAALLACALATPDVPAAQAQTVPVALPVLSSTTIEGSHVFCKQGCTLRSLTVTSGAVAGFVLILNSPTDPGNGSVAPAYCYPWPANYSAAIPWPVGATMQNGLTVVFSTGPNCTTETESATAFFAAQVQ